MKNIIQYILFLLLLLSSTTIQAQGHANVNTSDIVINLNGTITTGSISVAVDERFAPLDIEINGPCAEQINTTKTGASGIFTDPECAGTYCFYITSDSNMTPNDASDDCTMEFCVEVSICFQVRKQSAPDLPAYVTIVCKSRSPLGFTNNTPPDAVFLSGTSTKVGKEIQMQYMIHTYLSDKDLDPLLDDILDQTAILSDRIISTGASPYDIPNQKELNTNDDFVFKYDAEGGIVWVVHNEKIKTNKKYDVVGELTIKVDSETDPYKFEDTPISAYLSSRVYPNPFQHELNIELQTTKMTTIDLVLLNSIGSIVTVKKLELTKGWNNITLDIDKQIAKGMYLLQLKDNDQIIKTHKVVYQ